MCPLRNELPFRTESFVTDRFNLFGIKRCSHDLTQDAPVE